MDTKMINQASFLTLYKVDIFPAWTLHLVLVAMLLE